MAGSSGTRRAQRDEARECDAHDRDGIPCQWEGDVEVDYDAEVHVVVWECPECGTEHEEEWDWGE